MKEVRRNYVENSTNSGSIPYRTDGTGRWSENGKII